MGAIGMEDTKDVKEFKLPLYFLVFSVLTKEEKKINQILVDSETTYVNAHSILKEFISRGLVIKGDIGYKLTDDGKIAYDTFVTMCFNFKINCDKQILDKKINLKRSAMRVGGKTEDEINIILKEEGMLQ
jgi:predicted transcriptional regulator